MSKWKPHRSRTPGTPPTEDVLHALQQRAEERCQGLGHALGPWSPAKRKKHGTASQQALCQTCGEVVFVSPYLEYSRANPLVPAIKGEILFQLCYVEGRLL